MPIQKPLAELTLDELCAEIARRPLRDSEQLRGQIAKDFGIPIICTAGDSSAALDTDDLDSLSGRGYAAGTTAGPGGAGNFSEIQLWNGSSTHLLVRRITAYLGAVGVIGVRRHDAAVGIARTTIGNRFLTAADSLVEIRNLTPAALTGADVHENVPAPAQVPVEVVQRVPMVIPPGQGVVISGPLNTLLGAVFEWVERPL